MYVFVTYNSISYFETVTTVVLATSSADEAFDLNYESLSDADEKDEGSATGYSFNENVLINLS